MVKDKFSKENVNAVKDVALGKADELYNKLPLDKINDKLGGKVDVKSRKFKLIAACFLLTMLLSVIVCLFSCNKPDPVWVDSEWQNQLNFINALNEDQKREYFLISDFCFDNKLGDVIADKNIPRKGKKYSELIEAWRKALGPDNCQKLDEYIKSASADQHKASMNGYIHMLEHYIWVQNDGKKMLSKKYNAECVKLNVGGWNTGDTKDTVWIDAVAVFRKKSGQEFKMSFEVTTGLDRKTLLFTPKK